MIFDLNFKEIFESWIISFNPSEDEKILAEKRLNICSTCEFRKELIKKNNWSLYCGKCGCPLNKKIFSRIYNPCPLEKWEGVDSQHKIRVEKKKEGSII
jgi:hypothetical protein